METTPRRFGHALRGLAAGVAFAAACASPAVAIDFEDEASIPKTTTVVWNQDGERVGGGTILFARRDAGRRYLRVETRLDAGGGSDLEAELALTADGALRALWQRVRIYGADGAIAVETHIDHEKRRARCGGSEADPDAGPVVLEDGEALANVAVPLLLGAVSRSEIAEQRYQFLLCQGTPRIIDATASRIGARSLPGRPRVVEIESGLDLGRFLSWILGPFVPEIRFWLDLDDAERWVGHKMPIRPGTPALFILREGITPADLSS